MTEVPSVRATKEAASPPGHKGEARSSINVAEPTLVLPDGCSLVRPTSTFAIAICQPEPEPLTSKLVTGLPATAISVLALGLSLWTLMYNRRKDERARRQSIEDDFWLRKVVSPLSIEPFLKHVHELAAALPGAKGSTKQSVSDFWSDQAAKFGAFTVAFRTLALIDPELDRKVALGVEEIEDELAKYCGELGQHVEGAVPTAPDRDEASQRLVALTIAVFQLIKEHQSTVGSGRSTR